MNLRKVIPSLFLSAFMVGCGQSTFSGIENSQFKAESVDTPLSYGAPAYAMAAGGVIDTKESNGKKVVVESLIGQPLMGQFQKKDNFTIEIGYAHLQAHFGE